MKLVLNNGHSDSVCTTGMQNKPVLVGGNVRASIHAPGYKDFERRSRRLRNFSAFLGFISSLFKDAF
jgi:hypothetical protein